MQWDTVVILRRVRMDVYHSSALQVPFTAEAVEPTLWRRWILGNGSKLILSSSCGLPSSYTARLKRRGGLCSSHHTAALQFCGRALYWQWPLLPWAPSARPCCLLCIQSSGFLFGCKTLQMCQRDIPQREENPKNGWRYKGRILRLKHIDNAKECKVWITVTSSHSHVVYIGMYTFNFTVLLSSDKAIFKAESKLHSKINF